MDKRACGVGGTPPDFDDRLPPDREQCQVSGVQQYTAHGHSPSDAEYWLRGRLLMDCRKWEQHPYIMCDAAQMAQDRCR